MALIKNIVGEMFGNLKVLKLVGTDKHHKSIWECECSCGNITIVSSNNLKRGKVKSCGCRSTLFKNDETGNKYGKLLVIGPSNKGGWWKWECDCGNSGEHRGATIRKASSCGCKMEYGRNNKNWTGYKDIDGKYWRNIIASAKRRNLDFSIDLEYVWGLYESQNKRCAISGLPISFKYEGNRKIKRTASIDRIDSYEGYVKGNVQWLHQDINYMKRKLKDSDFIELCKSVAQHN